MKLKTLKDLKTFGRNEQNWVFTRSLKEEAIKWVKMGIKLEVTPAFKDGFISALKEFFNISEEDLK